VRFDNTTGFCVTVNCGVTSLRITYWDGWVDDGRINVYTDIGERYTCAKDETAVAFPVFIVRLLCITYTHRASLMFPNGAIVTLVDVP